MSQLFDSLDNEAIVTILKNGGIGVIPTDTVYGLVARAQDEAAINKMYHAKKRASQPGTIIAPSVESLEELGFDASELVRAAEYWPASVSVVLDATNIESYLKQVRTSLAVRIPNEPALHTLLVEVGPLMTSSANAPGEPTSTSIAEAQKYFGESVDFYVDGGNINGDHPSRIIGFDDSGQKVIYR